MSPPLTPIPTPMATLWLASHTTSSDRIQRALLSNVDGHRNVVQLESFARAMGLAPDALDRLRTQGLIELAS